MSDFVRVQTENGLYGSVSRAHAEATGMKIVEGDAVNRYGEPYGQSHSLDDQPTEGAVFVAPGESPYEGKSLADLKAEIDRRNASRPEDQQIRAGRSVADAVAALTAADGA
jgi:hypothetical protein